MSFVELGLSQPILRAIDAQGYSSPTPIQRRSIPHILAGRDFLGCAQTGTGKTAAFALPVLHRLSGTVSQPREVNHSQASSSAFATSGTNGSYTKAFGNPKPAHRPAAQGRRSLRCLVLAPTRELAGQISESFATYGRFSGLRETVIYGGVSQFNQVRALQQGVDILVATPGRLIDLMEQGHAHLNSIEVLILDEADQMLDMGFLPALKRIVTQVPRQRQTLLFSATMPTEIRRLADSWLRDPIEISVVPSGTPAELVQQSVFHVEPKDKPHLLAHYLRQGGRSRTLVFTRTKHGADKVVRNLEQRGIRAAAIHGNKSQSVRQRVLAQFRSDQPPVLVATDIAARGLDIDGVSHVINFDMPMVPELYVHRIGRTGRAGAEGRAVSFCGREERDLLRQIERLTRRAIEVESSPLPRSAEPVDVDRSAGQSSSVGPRPRHAESARSAVRAKSNHSSSNHSSAKANGSGRSGHPGGSGGSKRRWRQAR